MADMQFPSLLSKLTDPLWFQVEKPGDEDSELTKLEDEQRESAIIDKYNSVAPIGKPSTATPEEADDQDDDVDGDDMSESDNEDELDTDMIEERESGDEVI
ncbi:hypothetical protein HELRODRAFT_170437 [Helobdella robusta]|uniref:Uncharacterized protein n=1 Tax=Helobdella robusta TaxID=6412 RepID=T1F324_HELRO|nr:hypothetical protein HELRODRAFT_170437 [Helobdella robusta]ESO07135.1 hypothetical protein HELRODRAFT_170437 [Helobdella robusta]